MKHNHTHMIAATPVSPLSAQNPKRPYLTAVHQLAKRIPDVRAVFDHFGHVRTITTDSITGLFNQPMLGTPLQQAVKFLDVSEIKNALGLRDVTLDRGTIVDDPQLGHEVSFQQEIIADGGVRFPVRQGRITVYMDASGKVFNVNSTLRHGRRNTNLTGIISEQDAIDAAKADIGTLTYEDAPKVSLVFSSHNGRIEPVYEIVLCANDPRKVMRVLVKAHTGQVVYKTNLLRSSLRKGDPKAKAPVVHIEADDARGKKRRKPTPTVVTGTTGTTPVFGKAFLRIPDPNVAIASQVYDVLMESLPDPKVLRNDNFTMYIGNSKRPVQCKPDGTFKYDVNTPEFCAVSAFFALNAQMELMKAWGMKPPTRSLSVHVEDRSVSDNAYFDSEGFKIAIGIGTGLSNGGLTRYIGYDLGVLWHEDGHYFVFLQTPGQDLPGDEGGAIHESMGDTLGDLLMDWWFQLTYAKQLGITFGTAEVDADTRIIGKFALPPNGIRKAKNNKRTPKDKTGEVHDDGEISGAAKADLCVALVLKNGVAAGLELFGRMTLAALALVPSHKVTFRDLLNAYITADQRLNNGANKAAIVKAFDDHGITLSAKKGGGKTPIIIVVG